jgi:MSHA pilin protein MshC|tara:strand:- start:15792 stop:16277 length:486 start_codon:yes stop_codon:yes gene_type:complete
VAAGRQNGYSLIELILVLVLAGVLSAAAVGIFASRDSYDRRIIVDHWLGVFQQARQVSLSRSSDAAVGLVISQLGDQWLASLSADQGVVLSQTLERGGLSLLIGRRLAAGCSDLPSLPTTILFDGNGQLVPYQPLQLCVLSSPPIQLCVSASGYAYEGSCL